MFALSLKLALQMFWITLAVGDALKTETSVQSFSEGSDCRCKCILTTKDDGPCEDGVVGSGRKSIYFVETISGGSDCRCSCNTPPPSDCKSAPRRTIPDVSRDEDLDGIDLVELHGSISSMVSAMVKLENAIAERKSKDEEDFLQENLQKVVTDLKSTNGSYKDLIRDLELDSNNKNESVDISTTAEPTTHDHYPIVPPLKNPNPTREDATERPQNEELDPVGVVPIQTSTHPERIATVTVEPPITQRQDSTPEIVTTQIPPTTEAATIKTSSATATERTPPSDTSPITTTSAFTTASTTPETITTPVVTLASTTLRKTSTTLPPVRPMVVFIPYRAAKSPKSKRPEKNRDTPIEYDYDEFDFVATEKTTTNTTTTSRPASLSSTSTRSTTEGAESYADHLSEYEYDYDYDGEEEVVTTTSTTTTTISTTPPIDPCGTLFSISRPIVVSHFGRRTGAWMRDPVPSKTDPGRIKRIYIANFYYGNNLIEFDGLDEVRRLRYRNFYNLPHKWSGTGHIVYNGSFYYNRAFSTTLIKYNLQHRFVSAWTRLSYVIYNTRSPLTWKGHTSVHLAADEEGLWAIFPSNDPFDPHSRVAYMVNKIDPVDLRILESYRTKMRHPVSHAFMICGILYTTDRYNSKRARVNNAFDTRTSSQRPSYLAFEHKFAYAVQFSYNPHEKKIYAWDNGRQVEYRVGLIH